MLGTELWRHPAADDMGTSAVLAVRLHLRHDSARTVRRSSTGHAAGHVALLDGNAAHVRAIASARLSRRYRSRDGMLGADAAH